MGADQVCTLRSWSWGQVKGDRARKRRHQAQASQRARLCLEEAGSPQLCSLSLSPQDGWESPPPCPKVWVLVEWSKARALTHEKLFVPVPCLSLCLVAERRAGQLQGGPWKEGSSSLQGPPWTSASVGALCVSVHVRGCTQGR